MIESLTRAMVLSGAGWVLWCLFALSFVSIAIGLERAWTYRSANGDLELLVRELRKLLRQDDLRRARQLLSNGDSVEQRVVAAGLAESGSGPAAAEQAMAAAMGLERARLEKRLLVLGTIGNNAPFIGLLGTVIGVVGAFEELGRPQAMTSAMGAANALAPERVMGTIAEALVATAVGLIVAIPAVAVFNYFQGRVTSALADAQTLGHVLLSHLEGKPSRELARHSEPEGHTRDSLAHAAE
ncbi:MAG TPA: MotA/TolQ/ExbB proton channel family protein [Polyangiales bacterium]|jgi:biopolymer transport protein ExbB|nr:MotA/TolQ/ExbB proton channel family protein [Polyangiales bacterium]